MRAAIETALHDLGSASAKAIATHAGLERQDTLNELLAMVDEGAAHREKRNSNEYWYWLDETHAAIPRLGQPAALPEEPARLDDHEPQATSAQPASGAMNNPGSSGSAPPNGTPSAGAAALPTADHYAELQRALDEIDRLKQERDYWMEMENHSVANIIRALQEHIEDGMFAEIGSDYLRIGWCDNLFDASPDDFCDVMTCAAELEARIV